MAKYKVYIGIFAAILTCSGVFTANAQNYYPTNLGNVWVFESQDKAERITYTLDASEESINEIDLALLNITNETLGTDTITTDQFFVDFEEDGIKLYKFSVDLGPIFGIVSGLLYPPVLFYPSVMVLHDAWQYTTDLEVKLVGPVEFTTINTVVDIVDVETPAGKFEDCLKIQIRSISTSTLSITRSTAYQWLAPDIGPVKFENDQDIVYELISSNLIPDYDVNDDGVINILDLVFVASRFGENNSEADVNHDGIVGIKDLTLVAENFSE